MNQRRGEWLIWVMDWFIAWIVQSGYDGEWVGGGVGVVPVSICDPMTSVNLSYKYSCASDKVVLFIYVYVYTYIRML